jgi:carbon storage regulator
MLVLSRKVGERVVVPECDLAVTIVAIEGNKVRLGFSAPADVEVYREEIWQEIEEEETQRMRPTHRFPTQKGDKDRDPFFLTVFHEGEVSHG